jgi:FixJ family two-component response regulator
MKGAPTAAVVARDDGLRTSLLFVLCAYGLAVREFDHIDGFLASQCPREATLFVDLDLLGQAGPGLATKLRSNGWQGTAVLMVEDEAHWTLPDGEPAGCMVLVKPFSSDDVLKVIGMVAVS